MSHDKVRRKCEDAPVSGGDDGDEGVLDGSPADLFENFSAEEAGLVADAAPFRDRPMPIGGSRKGRPNKRTIAMRELYLKSGFPHPLLWQGSMLRLGVDGVAKALGCDLVDAAELLRKIASDALPYIEGKMPTKVILEGDARVPVLVFGDLGAAGRVLDQARAKADCALITEHHAPHGEGPVRSVRPVGSSLLMRWPEFGYGLRWTEDPQGAVKRTVDMVSWRGDRDEREWPDMLTAGGVWPWKVYDTASAGWGSES